MDFYKPIKEASPGPQVKLLRHTEHCRCVSVTDPAAYHHYLRNPVCHLLPAIEQ